MSDARDSHPAARERAGDFDLEIIDREQFTHGLEKEWDEFVGRCENNHPFNSFSWLTYWLAAFYPEGDHKVLLARKNGRLCCALPVLQPVKARGGFTVGQSWVNPFSFRAGLLCDPECLDAVHPLLQALRRLGRWDRFDFYFSPRDTKVHAALVEAAGRVGSGVVVEDDMHSPVMRLDGTWDDFIGSLSRRRRESERRKHKKLVDKMGATIRILHGDADGLSSALQDCWEVSRKTWKHRDGSSIAARPERMKFFEDVAEANRDWIVVAVLYIDNKPIAFEYNLLYEGCLYNLKLGYDEEHRNLSAGQVLRFNMIEWSFAHGVRTFDFMGHAAAYKVAFSDSTCFHETVYVYGTTWRGRVAAFYQARVRPVLRRVKGRVLPARGREAPG